MMTENTYKENTPRHESSIKLLSEDSSSGSVIYKQDSYSDRVLVVMGNPEDLSKFRTFLVAKSDLAKGVQAISQFKFLSMNSLILLPDQEETLSRILKWSMLFIQVNKLSLTLEVINRITPKPSIKESFNIKEYKADSKPTGITQQYTFNDLLRILRACKPYGSQPKEFLEDPIPEVMLEKQRTNVISLCLRAKHAHRSRALTHYQHEKRNSRFLSNRSTGYIPYRPYS